MTLAGDLTKGVLSNAAATIYTAGSSPIKEEAISIMFRNKTTSAVSLYLYLNGNGEDDMVYATNLDAKPGDSPTGGMVTFQVFLGPGDVIQAKGSADASIVWHLSKGALS